MVKADCFIFCIHQQSALLFGGSFLFVPITAAEPVVKNIITSSSELWQWLCINYAHVQSFVWLMRHELLTKAIDPLSSLMYLLFFPTVFINLTESNSNFSTVSICHLLRYYSNFLSRLSVFLFCGNYFSCFSCFVLTAQILVPIVQFNSCFHTPLRVFSVLEKHFELHKLHK